MAKVFDDPHLFLHEDSVKHDCKTYSSNEGHLSANVDRSVKYPLFAELCGNIALIHFPFVTIETATVRMERRDKDPIL